MNGWMPGVERVETAAQGGYGVATGQFHAKAVCCHVIEGWLSTMKMWARERPPHHEASYHFVTALDGHIVQFVRIDNTAWHAGRRDYVDASGRLVSSRAPGARIVEPTWPLWNKASNPGAETVAIAREGFSVNPWTPEQVDATVRIAAWVMEQHGLAPSAETLIGHYELNPRTRTNDPGWGWDKDVLLALLSDGEAQPGDLVAGTYTLPNGASLTVD